MCIVSSIQKRVGRVGENVSRRWIALALSAVVIGSPTAQAGNLKCLVGFGTCVKSQGTSIPLADANAIADSCREFIVSDIGRIALRMSAKEVLDRSGGNASPLFRAWTAVGDLYDSSLAFERKAKIEDTNYLEVKRACLILSRDMNDSSKVTH